MEVLEEFFYAKPPRWWLRAPAPPSTELTPSTIPARLQGAAPLHEAATIVSVMHIHQTLLSPVTIRDELTAVLS
jgi:hypothetical protein